MTTPWMQYIPFGDAEAAVVDILLNETPELDFPGKPTIQTNLIGYTAGARWIEVSQQGTLRRWPKIDRPRVDVEVFAERRSVAKDIAEIALASIIRQMGTYRGFGLFISDVKVEQGITRIPDKFQESTRYLFSLRLTCTPYGPPLGFAAS